MPHCSVFVQATQLQSQLTLNSYATTFLYVRAKERWLILIRRFWHECSWYYAAACTVDYRWIGRRCLTVFSFCMVCYNKKSHSIFLKLATIRFDDDAAVIMLLQQRCLVYLHAACACIVTGEPAAAAAFFDSDSCMVYLHAAL